MEENKLERAVGQFLSAHQLEIGSTELAPTFLVVTLLLTHFALGYLQVMPGVSYADAMCLGGVTAIGSHSRSAITCEKEAYCIISHLRFPLSPASRSSYPESRTFPGTEPHYLRRQFVQAHS